MIRKYLQALDDEGIACPSPAYLRMAETWKLIEDLMGGTHAMIEAGTEWLPREPKEDTRNYQRRLKNSVLYGGYRDTVRDLSSRPFQREVDMISEELLTEELQRLSSNINATGQDITQFGRRVLKSVIKHGHTCLFIDYPRTRGPEGEDLFPTVAHRRHLRPRIIHVEATQVFGWEVSEIDGIEQVTSVRFIECTTRPSADDSYKTDEVYRVRKIDASGEYEVHEKVMSANKKSSGGSNNEAAKFALVEKGKITHPQLPWVTIYAEQEGHMISTPPLEDLAWLNLAHWRSDSDQRAGLRAARHALLVAKGFDDDDIGDVLVMGPNSYIKTSNPEATLEYVENAGIGLSHGRTDLESLEERMTVMGLRPVMARLGGTTATSRVVDESRTSASLQSWATGTEQGMIEAYEIAGQWSKADYQLPKAFDINIFKDFTITSGSAEAVAQLLATRKAREISHPTFIDEVKRRGLLSDMVITQEEVEAVRNEAPDYGFDSPSSAATPRGVVGDPSVEDPDV